MFKNIKVENSAHRTRDNPEPKAKSPQLNGKWYMST